MVYIYLFSILLARVVQAIFSKRSSNEVRSLTLTVKYTTYQYTISSVLGLILLMFGAQGFQINYVTVGIVLLSGISLFFSSFCSLYGMKSGTVSLVSMFGTAGLIVPIIAGVFMFHQPISMMQGFGTGLFFVSAWLLIKNSKITYSNFSMKTVLLLAGAMLANGFTMLAQQMYTYYVPNGNISFFSFASFVVVAVLGVPVIAIVGKTEKTAVENTKFSKSLLICGIALAGAVFVINQFVTSLTTLLPPVILFTFVNGGGTIISTLVAAVMYREKLSFFSILGVILGIVSFIIIKMF